MIYETCQNPKYYNNMWRACGKCPKCKAQRQREWTLRGKLEALNHKNNIIFATFTYKNKKLVRTAIRKENELDQKGTLVKKHAELMIKRLRKKLGKNHKKIKYILCGEYGQKTFRPHLHAIFYGINTLELSQSEWRKIWKQGNVQIKPVTSINQIAYVVGYINKKITDKTTKEHYELNGRIAPFQRQSQKIGLDWAIKNKNHWVSTLKTYLNNKETSIPRYFIKKIYELEGIKQKLTHKIITCEIDEFKILTKKHTSKEYKTFINPNGELTSALLNKELEYQLSTIEDFGIRTNTPTKIMKQETIFNHKNRIEKIKNQWIDINNLTTEEIINKYQHTTYRFINQLTKKPEQSHKPIEIDNKTWLKIRNYSRINNYKTKTKAKHRAGIEKDEESKKFIHTFK